MIKLGLIGYPLGHSLSPKIHAAALDFCQLAGQYQLYPVPPDQIGELKILLNQVRRDEIQGLNVTIPYKQTIIPMLDRLTPTANAIGAVNTIFMQGGKLIGDNTDAAGFLADMHNAFAVEKWESENTNKALVIGAGGSANAVTYALLHDGWVVTVAARRPEQAKRLIEQFPNHAHQLSYTKYPINALTPNLGSLDLIVNTTPLGMSPTTEDSPWPDNLPFPKQAFIYDLIYNPFETRLVLDARAAGLQAITGRGMLVGQAMLAFKLWTGLDVSGEKLFELIFA